MNTDEIAAIIGIENLKKLSAHCGGESIYISTKYGLDERNKQISQEFSFMLQGGSSCMNAYQTIAEENHLSRRRVRQIVAAE